MASDKLNRPNPGAFKPGQSGNPSGRPKSDHRIQELARQHTPLALQTLADICANGEVESARVSAAIALLDRGWGKPPQAIVGGGEDDPPIQLAEIIIRAVDAAGDRSAAQGS